MEMVGVRELQQNASAVLRRVRGGEQVGVTDRGTLVALLSPPPTARGAAALIATGRTRPATRSLDELPEPQPAARPTGDVLDELRAESRR